jgi:hypothetical protein
MNEEFLSHHGYVLMGHLFANDLSQTPGGPPWYFYFLFLAVKLPLPILLAFKFGVCEVFRRRGTYPHSRGYLFLRLLLVCWLFPEALLGVKFLRYALPLMPFIYMAAAVGIVVIAAGVTKVSNRLLPTKPVTRAIASLGTAAFLVIAPSVTTITSVLNSHPSLYVNILGGGRVGYFFPHDEFYDLGARESIRFIAETAPRGALIASEIPGVVQYYLERFNRPDIRSRSLSRSGFEPSETHPEFVVLQPGRVYFENLEISSRIEGSFPLVQSSVFEGTPATRVYAINAR